MNIHFSSEDNTDHCRDSETEAFRAAVTNSSSDVFFKSTGAGGGGVMAKAMTTSVTTRTSPLRSNSLILPEDTESTSEAARKRSCPAVATIPEDQSLTPDEARAKVETMAASIVHHDSKVTNSKREVKSAVHPEFSSLARPRAHHHTG